MNPSLKTIYSKIYSLVLTPPIWFLFLLLTWFIFAGVGIWSYASIEIEPPVFDALSYVHKAQSFWTSLLSFQIFNPLSIEPTIRPFGTVLLSYPFGFSDDFSAFYFRSSFIPLIIFGLSPFIFLQYKKLSVGQQLILVSLCIASASAPSLFQFAMNEGVTVMGTWGFVDLFFAAIAVLAVSCMLSENPGKFVRNSTIAAALSAFTILVKPAGLVLMLVIAFAWLIITLYKVKISTITVSELQKGGVSFVIIYLLMALALYKSSYFSREHYQFGINAMKMLRAASDGFPSMLLIADRLRVSFGLPLTLILFVGLLTSALNRKYWGHHLSALMLLAAGVVVWLGLNNIDHVRYFLPFPYMALMLVLPSIVNGAQQLSMQASIFVAGVILAPAMLIAAALAQNPPDESLQHKLGINLSAQNYPEVVDQAKVLVSELSKESNKQNIIYLCGIRPRVRAFESVIDWNRILKFSTANLVIDLPITWVEDHVYKLNSFIRSQFIVFEPVADPNSVLHANPAVTTFEQEELVIRSWLSTLTEVQGVRIRSESAVRVLEVVDKNKLTAAAGDLYESRTWREIFLRNFTKPVVEVGKTLPKSRNLIRSINDFKDTNNKVVLRICGLFESIIDGKKTLRIFIENNQLMESGWFVFVHSTGAPAGANQVIGQLPLRQEISHTGESYEYTLVVPAEFLTQKLNYAIGLFKPNIGGTDFLFSKDGDWGGRRMIVTEEHGREQK